MIKIMHREVSPFVTNCYLVIDTASSHAALVDPGDDPEVLMKMIEQAKAEVKYLLATHCHVDHIGAAAEMAKRLNLGLMACERDAFLLQALPDVCNMYGLKVVEIPTIEINIDEGDELTLGESRLRFLKTPGHSPGSLVIRVNDTDLLAGDVLFAGSIGRADLPGGNMRALENSIMKVVLPLGDEVRVHPGHGPATTIGWEKKSNPFILEWSAA
jgi:glyoxylase-like metal-dependent hydrolase (beta-lactamase superfamily II)